MSSPLLLHYRQYAEYKCYYRKSSDNFVSFIQGYERLKKEVEDSIFLKCSRLQIQILDLLSVCNLANDDVENILNTLEAEPSENPYDKIKLLIIDIASELEDLVDTKIELEDSEDIEIKPKQGVNLANSDLDNDYGPEEDNRDDDEDSDFKESPSKKRKYNKCPPIPQNENGRYICTRCGKDFPRADNVRLHLNKKKKCKPSDLQAHLPVSGFNGSNHNQTHVNKEEINGQEEDNDTPLPLEDTEDDGGKTPKKRGRKSNHFSEFPQNEDGRFLCVRCGRDFPRADNVRLHQNRKKICVPLVDRTQRLQLIVQQGEAGHEYSDKIEDIRQVDQIIKSPGARLDYEKIPQNKEGRFVCTRCGKDFARAENVRNHQITLKQNRCVPISQEQFINSIKDLSWEHVELSEEDLKEVVEDDTLNENTAIKIKIVKNDEKEEDTKNHFGSDDLKETRKRYECDQCEKDFPTPEKVLAHKTSLGCIKNRTYKWASKVEAIEIEEPGEAEDGKPMKKKVKYIGYCKLCDHKTHPTELKRHVLDVHFKERKQCPICGKMVRVRYLPFHMRKHEDYASGPDIKCDMCDWTTKVKEHLQNHIRRMHSEKNISCDICGERFSYGAALTKHLQIKHGEDLLCSHCDFKTKDISTLKSHLKRFHTKPGSFLCTRCTFETKSSDDLKLHINSVHGGDIVDKALTTNRKEYNCDMCDHKANGKNSLRGHKASVHWNLQFKCEECDFVASYKLKLRDHVNRVHRGIKYDCKFCDFSTPNQKSHTIHNMNKHPEEFKLYYCHLCNYRTQHKDLLQRHLTGKYGKHNSNSYG